MEALGSLAILITIGSFILSVAIIIAFFIMTSNISDIAKKVHHTSFQQEQIALKLDKIIRLMEKEVVKEKVQNAAG